MRMLITITATVLQGFKKETYSCSFTDIYAISSVYCFVYWSLLCNPRLENIISRLLTSPFYSRSDSGERVNRTWEAENENEEKPEVH